MTRNCKLINTEMQNGQIDARALIEYKRTVTAWGTRAGVGVLVLLALVKVTHSPNFFFNADFTARIIKSRYRDNVINLQTTVCYVGCLYDVQRGESACLKQYIQHTFLFILGILTTDNTITHLRWLSLDAFTLTSNHWQNSRDIVHSLKSRTRWNWHPCFLPSFKMCRIVLWRRYVR